jgi:[acyl-carrier-protein] S-malonyltransferase
LKTAHLFPAFVTEYLGIETKVISTDKLYFKLEKASDILDCPVKNFEIKNNTFTDDPLMSQYVAYVMSCCVSDMLHAHNMVPDFVAAYSMGIYAALYHCRAIDFETGLHMIQSAYSCIEDNLPVHAMGMCIIGGLSVEDLMWITKRYVDKVSIVNQNSEFSFLLSGQQIALLKISDSAKAEGAMLVKMLPVTHPYHHVKLKKASEDFSLHLKDLTVNDCIFPLISAQNQNIIHTKEQIIHELVSNLYHLFHWWDTFRLMLLQDVDLFIECGAGESLLKIAKFIDGDFRVMNLKKIEHYLETSTPNS